MVKASEPYSVAASFGGAGDSPREGTGETGGKRKEKPPKKKKGAGCAASPGITGRHTNGEGNLINRKAKERKEKGGRDKRN